MTLAESLYCDLRQSGVCVQLANPGFIKTRLTDKNKFNMPYIMPPERAAKIMLAHMQSHRFKKSFPTFFSLLFRAANFSARLVILPAFLARDFVLKPHQ